jgi:hypothetical protein
MKPRIQGKPIAKIAPFFVLGNFRVGFSTVPPGAGKIKTAVPANPEIPAAISAPKGSSQGFRLFDHGTAIPAHKSIISRPERPCKGFIFVQKTMLNLPLAEKTINSYISYGGCFKMWILEQPLLTISYE